MKIKLIISILLIAFLSSCSESRERVTLSPGISIELPESYEVSGSKDSRRFPQKYTANLNQDRIYIFSFVASEFDSLDIEKRKEALQINADRFISSFKGHLINSSDTVFKEIIVKRFAFEYERQDSSYVVFNRMILNSIDYHLLAYQIKEPISEESTKMKNKFFKSLIIK